MLPVDTPELGSGECYSRAARTALLGLAPVGAKVVLESDARLDRTDRYGRLLRYVKRNGVNANVELVRRGAAAPYFYRGERGRYAASPMRRGAEREGVEARALEGVPLDRPRPRSCRHDRPQRAVDSEADANR